MVVVGSIRIYSFYGGTGMKNWNLLAVIFVMSFLWLAIGCSQKSVHSELTPPPAAFNADPLVISSDLKQPATSYKGINPAIAANSLGDSGLIVEPLDAKPAVNGAQNKFTLSSEGRSSGPLLPVYFDFAQARIRDDQLARIENNASFIKKQNVVKVRIEGNCDERGTQEYNLALGERRALSVKKFMADLGIDEGRIEILSYGEERPLVQGHAEADRALNRRGDFLIGL